MAYNDNRDVPVKIVEKKKYHPHIQSTVAYFNAIFKDKTKYVVDVGARDGYSTQLLRDCGFGVIGTELITDYAVYAQKNGRNVVCDDIMETSMPENYCDIIFSRHCIEHCRDTVQFFKSCEKILRPNGKIFLTFPLETKKKFKARKYPGLNHMVYFETKDDFRRILKKTNIRTLFLGKSKQFGILPDGNEILFMGTLDAKKLQ